MPLPTTNLVIGQLLRSLVTEGACQHLCFSSKQSKEKHFPGEYQDLLYPSACTFIISPELTRTRESKCTHNSCFLMCKKYAMLATHQIYQR